MLTTFGIWKGEINPPQITMCVKVLCLNVYVLFRIYGTLDIVRSLFVLTAGTIATCVYADHDLFSLSNLWSNIALAKNTITLSSLLTTTCFLVSVIEWTLWMEIRMI